MPSRGSASAPLPPAVPEIAPRRMRLRYGFNEIYGWYHFSRGEHREQVRRRLRLMGTGVVRLFVFDQPVPDPIRDWPAFAGCIDAVRDIGATPMITLAKFPAPHDDAANLRSFVARCTELVWSAVETWGGAAVKDWYWCVWNEPNNLLVGGDLSFAQYRRIYEAVAAGILPVLEPHLGGGKLRLGGPAIDGTHRAYWMDWIARLLAEVDGRLVSFVSWHRYGDWRPAVPSASLGLEMWGAPDAPDGEVLEALLMAQTPDYEARALGVSRLLAGRDILNVCGELNTLSHHEQYYTLGLNQNLFGAAYYASALIHLLRGGADLEMRWTATRHTDAYGLVLDDGRPTPAGLAKQLFAQHVRFGDWLRLPPRMAGMPEIDAVVAWNEDGRRAGVFVNTAPGPRLLVPAQWDPALAGCRDLLRLDRTAGERIVREPFAGTVRLDGYGLAVVTDMGPDIVLD